MKAPFFRLNDSIGPMRKGIGLVELEVDQLPTPKGVCVIKLGVIIGSAGGVVFSEIVKETSMANR